MPLSILVSSRVVKLGSIESLGNIWRDQEVWPEGRTYPGAGKILCSITVRATMLTCISQSFAGVLVIEFRGPLSFASADHFMEEALACSGPLRVRPPASALRCVADRGLFAVLTVQLQCLRQVENKRLEEEEAGNPVDVIVLPFGSAPHLKID